MKLLSRLRVPSEPVLWESLAKALLGLVIGWPLIHLTHAHEGLVLAVYAPVAAIVVRGRVTPNAKVAEKVDQAVKANTAEIHDYLAAARPLRAKP